MPAHSLTEPAPLHDGQGYQPQQLVLVGAGRAHQQLMLRLAASPLLGVRITLITPHANPVCATWMPGFVAGHHTLEACTTPVEPLVRRCGIRWLPRSVKGLDTTARTLTMDDATAIHFDWLSINGGPVQNRALLEERIPGVREFGLFVRPWESFCTLWPKVVERGATRGLRIAIIGAGSLAAELALAMRERLPSASITWLSGNEAPAANLPATLHSRLLAILKAKNITVLRDVAVAVRHSEVGLGCGASLACDVPIVVQGEHPPTWLSGNSLALDDQGRISVDGMQRSTSHPHIFACGEVSSQPHGSAPQPGLDTAKVGNALADNLAAAVSGGTLRAHRSTQALRVLRCGNRSAIVNWQGYSAQGRWVWWLLYLLAQWRASRYRV